MSVVGAIHIRCGFVGKCGGHVFPVDAREYIDEMCEAERQAVLTQAISWTGPQRYCPRCEAIDISRGVDTERQRDERIEARRLAQEAEIKEE